jgi:hypothetical protein
LTSDLDYFSVAQTKGASQMRLISHVVGAALKDLFSAIGAAIFSGAIGGGAVLLVSYAYLHQWTPTILTDVTAGIIALLAGYAGWTTMLLRSISRTVLGAGKAVEQEAKQIA